MDKGKYQPSNTGTPQGGNLSPLLSNIMLHELDKDLARLTSYCGDRYYFVATKTCVSRATSKDILIQRGLVSP